MIEAKDESGHVVTQVAKQVTRSVKLVFGVPAETKPFHNLPEGARVRLRLRNNEFARAYVRTGKDITCYVIKETLDWWVLVYPQAKNSTKGGD